MYGENVMMSKEQVRELLALTSADMVDGEDVKLPLDIPTGVEDAEGIDVKVLPTGELEVVL